MAKALPPEIVDLSEYTESINILCHGETGSGKTVLWAGLPNVLILAIEEGTVSAARRLGPAKKGELRKVVRCRSWSDIVKWFEWVRDNPGIFDWVIIDSITKAQQYCIKHIMQVVVKDNPKRDPHIPAQGDHFKWQLMMKEMVSDWNDLETNVIWLARSMNKEDTEGNDIVVPLIEGKDYQISAWVSGEVHLLCYLKKVSKKDGGMDRVLYTNNHPTYYTKDRFDALPEVIKNPDARKIVARLNNDPGQRQPDETSKTTAKKAADKRRK